MIADSPRRTCSRSGPVGREPGNPRGGEVRLAAEHARIAGDTALRSRALGWYVATLLYGPSPADSITAELRAIAAQDPGPSLAAFLALGWAEVNRLSGRFDGPTTRWRRRSTDSAPSARTS